MRSTMMTSSTMMTTTATTMTSIVVVPNSAGGMTPDVASVSYDAYASGYDVIDGGAIASYVGIDDARSSLLGDPNLVHGRVLEVGVGTGLNLEYYYPGLFDRGGIDDGIVSLTLVDVSGGMLDAARERWESMLMMTSDVGGGGGRRGRRGGGADGVPSVEFVKADATTQLTSTFGASSFDVAIDTFGLCVMGDEGARMCLREMTDVVRRGGYVLLIENTKSSNPLLGYYQDITASAAASMGGKGSFFFFFSHSLVFHPSFLSSSSSSPSLLVVVDAPLSPPPGTSRVQLYYFAILNLYRGGGKGCLYNQDVGRMIRQTEGLRLIREETFAAGFFRSFICQKI
ncbi:hypothetical protein ACHAXA_011378 [Cyclostephanos tholiformis]|uniref:Methyltransferase type 11 domain-containing protein n=1 Tax=Cyclostephanos tholiformis TaxID=382380 RepID=A0ABD3R6X3_9STRA